MRYRLSAEHRETIKNESIGSRMRLLGGRSGRQRRWRCSIFVAFVIGYVFISFCADFVFAQQVTVRISKADVRRISTVVRAVTREPIISIGPVYSLTAKPGAVPLDDVQLNISKAGKIQSKRVVTYELSDQVSVRTGSDNNLTGGIYELKRTRQGWKIVFKSGWIH